MGAYRLTRIQGDSAGRSFDANDDAAALWEAKRMAGQFLPPGAGPKRPVAFELARPHQDGWLTYHVFVAR
jgi:hypothetical protein